MSVWIALLSLLSLSMVPSLLSLSRSLEGGLRGRVRWLQAQRLPFGTQKSKSWVG